MRILKKLTTKEMALEIGKGVLIAGVVRTAEPVDSQFGDTCYKFLGSFGAVLETVVNGVPTVETLRSGVMYVPEVLQNLLVDMVENGLNTAGDAFQGVEFVYRLVKTPDSDERNARKYKWSVETVTEPTPATDPVVAMLAHHAPSVVLAAPVADGNANDKDEPADGKTTGKEKGKGKN